MKTIIISKELNSLEFQVLRDFMKNLIKESMQTIDKHDAEKLSWYKDCSMNDYFTELQEIWDDDEKVGEGIDAISLKFILNDETSSDFENAFEQARDEAYQYLVEHLAEEIKEYAEENEFKQVIEINDEVTEHEREELPQCTDNEIIASRIDEVCERIEKEGYKRFCIDDNELIEFESQIATDLNDEENLPAAEIAKWFGCQIMVCYEGNEPFDYQNTFYIKK